MLDPMTLDQLRVAVAIADTGSFSAAARRLQRAQSAISQSVRALETTLRLPIFDRSARTPRLTEAGRALLDDARRLLRGAEALRARAQDMVGGLEAELALAIDPLVPSDVVMAALRGMGEAFPGLPVRLLTEAMGAPERHLRDGTVRQALCVLMSRPHDLEAEFLTSALLRPVVAAAHPLAALDGPVPREALSDHVQLVLTDHSGDGDRSFNVIGGRIWRFADMHTRLEFLLGGFGWCHMPEHMVAPHVASGRLRHLALRDHPGFAMAIHAMHRRDHPPGLAGRWLLERIRTELAGRGHPLAPSGLERPADDPLNVRE